MHSRINQIVIFLFVVSITIAQDESPRVQSLRQEWSDHASFQRKELISFINFLYEQEFYERARLSLFEFLFRLPDDPLKPAAYYYIGDCYEQEGQFDLALKYYGQAIDESDSGSVVHTASGLRRAECYLRLKEWDTVLEFTERTEDPYLLTYRGYAHLNQLEFIEARISFKAAEAQFDNKVYSRRIAPILRAIDIVDNIEVKSKSRTIIAGLVPGGGRAYLKGWQSAAGAAVTTAVLAAFASRTFDGNEGSMGFEEPVGNWVPAGSDYPEAGQGQRLLPRSLKLKSPSRSIILPAIAAGIGVYVGSIWGAVNDIHAQNRRLKERAVVKVSNRYPPEKFRDYTEPQFY